MTPLRYNQNPWRGYRDLKLLLHTSVPISPGVKAGPEANRDESIRVMKQSVFKPEWLNLVWTFLVCNLGIISAFLLSELPDSPNVWHLPKAFLKKKRGFISKALLLCKRIAHSIFLSLCLLPLLGMARSCLFFAGLLCVHAENLCPQFLHISKYFSLFFSTLWETLILLTGFHLGRCGLQLLAAHVVPHKASCITLFLALSHFLLVSHQDLPLI